jgi:hypothetical protein
MDAVRSQIYIAGGHVYCRVRHADMDIAKCFSCTRLKVLGDQASPPFIVCDTSGAVSDLEDAQAYARWRQQHHRPERGFAS